MLLNITGQTPDVTGTGLGKPSCTSVVSIARLLGVLLLEMTSDGPGCLTCRMLTVIIPDREAAVQRALIAN